MSANQDWADADISVRDARHAFTSPLAKGE
jgi:hypothetical protein